MTHLNPAFVVDLQPTGRRADISADTTLLAAAQSVGVELQSICGGAGTCGSCRVRLAGGRLSAPSPVEVQELGEEALAAGYRLACQAVPLTNVRVDIPPESLTGAQRVQIEGLETDITPDPIVAPVDCELPPPSFSDLRPDVTRVRAAVSDFFHRTPDSKGLETGEVCAELTIPLPMMAELPDRLRAQNWSARFGVRRESGARRLVTVLPPGSTLLGLAVDIGTSTIAAYLTDLQTGKVAARRGAMNPQIASGEDLISRISYANQSDENRKTLQTRLIGSLNRLAAELCAEIDACREQIAEAVVVGNTAMHHLFAGLPVEQLGTAPYLPATTDPLHLPARDVGLGLAPGAIVYLPPNIAGYVGADHVAMLLATGMAGKRKATLAIDIGTNTEITLNSEGRLLACSCASGPAFEGAHIQAGMRAAPGAIERVRILGNEVHSYTIGRLPAVGICGSGILDAVAEMLDAGVLDERGNFSQTAPHVRTRNGQSEFVLVSASATGQETDIVVTRQDVNEIQLAKAAIRAGIEVLLEQAGIKRGDVEEIVLAGAFGTYLDLRSAARVGLLPPLPLGRYRQVGNAAGMGARHMLISAEQRRAGEKIARRVEYVELSAHPSFHEKFVNALFF